MRDWFFSIGWGAYPILALGLGSLVVGILAIRQPTKGKLAALRSLPSLIMLNTVFVLGTNIWAVDTHLTDDAFVKARSITGDQLPFVAMMGFCEAAQAVTLGGLMAMLVMVLRMVVESRALKQTAAQG